MLTTITAARVWAGCIDQDGGVKCLPKYMWIRSIPRLTAAAAVAAGPVSLHSSQLVFGMVKK